MTKVELSEVLRAHESEAGGWACSCCNGFDIGDHTDHLADVVLAWVGERAGDAAVVEAVAEVLSVECGDMTGYSPTAHPDHNRWSWRGDGHGEEMRTESRNGASAALTAFVGTLGGPGASAWVEVAPGATDELAGAQNGCEHAAWVQGFLAAHYSDRGGPLPANHPLEAPSHLTDDLTTWSPYCQREDRR